MPVAQVVGAVLGGVGTVVLLLALSETRHEVLGPEWGVALLFKGKPRFASVWVAAAVPGLVALFCGGIIGRSVIEGRRLVYAAVAGLALGAVGGVLLFAPAAAGQKRAGRNTLALSGYIGALLGGATAAHATDRWLRRRGRFSN